MELPKSNGIHLQARSFRYEGPFENSGRFHMLVATDFHGTTYKGETAISF